MATVGEWTGVDVKAFRLAARMTQPEFAAWVGVNKRTIRRWETTGHAGAFNQSILDSLLASASDDVLEQFRRIRNRTSGQEDTMDRRTLFVASSAVAAGALTALGLTSDADERARWLMSGAGRPDRDSLTLVRGTLHQAMLLDDAMGSAAAEGMVIAQQSLTEAMLRKSTPTLRPELLALNAQFLGFAGCLAWDVGDHGNAARLYKLARETAHDATDVDVYAYMLCHMSQLSLAMKRPRGALDDAVAARSWVAQSGDVRLRAYTEMRVAEAAASNGQRRACLDALATAEHEIGDAGIAGEVSPDVSLAYFTTPALLESYRGWCWSLLGEPEKAVVASRHAVDLTDPRRARDKAMMLMELERAYIQQHDIDHAAGAVCEAAELVERNRSPRLIKAVMEGRQLLTPWASSRAVRELDAVLAERDMVQV